MAVATKFNVKIKINSAKNVSSRFSVSRTTCAYLHVAVHILCIENNFRKYKMHSCVNPFALSWYNLIRKIQSVNTGSFGER